MAAVLPSIVLNPSVSRSRPVSSPVLIASPGLWRLPSLRPPHPRRLQREVAKEALVPVARPAAGCAWPLVLAALLMGLAAIAAPERPQDQEAICQRQSGEAACRVW